MATKRTYLPLVKSHALASLVIEKYAEKGVSDEEFAKWAEGEIGFSPITSHHIFYIRKNFQIPGSRKASTPSPRLAELEGVILGLQHRLTILEKRVDTYISGGR